MEKRKTNILLELIDDIILEYPNTKECRQQKLYEKCDREEIPIDKVIFLASLKVKNIFTNQRFYITYHLVLRCNALWAFVFYLFEVQLAVLHTLLAGLKV